VFTSIPVDMAVGVAETLLLKLGRHHKVYGIKMQNCSCKFDAMEGGVKRYRFKLADVTVDWYSLFSGRRSRAALKDMCLRDILAVNNDERADLIEE
jgi:hypothetical protein